jgi:hypothetical protein
MRVSTILKKDTFGKSACLDKIQHNGQTKHYASKVVKRYITHLRQSYMVS